MELVYCNGKQYKKCCGNCKYYLGRNNFNDYNNNCDCEEKRIELNGKFFRNHYSSDEPCKYFCFEAKREYKIKQTPIMEAATLLKNYCKENECNEKCELFNKEENYCRLSFSVSEWDI